MELAIAAYQELQNATGSDREGKSKVTDHETSELSAQVPDKMASGATNNATQVLLSPSPDNSQPSTSTPTPPTSTSDGFQSQSTTTELSQLSQLSQLAAAAQSITSDARPAFSGVPSGFKRTADGQMKPNFTTTTSPQGKAKGHSRNTSTVSTISTASSKMGEVNNAI